MKSKGIIRKIDELGRIVIPMEIRRSLDIDIKDCISINLNKNNQIILNKIEDCCIFCERNENLVDYNGRKICEDCLRKLRKISS